MKIKRLEGNNPLPSKATEFSAGFDLRAIESGVMVAGTPMLIKTGFAMEIPVGHVGMVCPRSGLALKHGVTVLNAPGIIDADYRGDVGIILMKHSQGVFEFEAGDRIAQLVILQMPPMGAIREVGELDDTGRGEGGFGHTGEG